MASAKQNKAHTNLKQRAELGNRLYRVYTQVLQSTMHRQSVKNVNTAELRQSFYRADTERPQITELKQSLDNAYKELIQRLYKPRTDHCPLTHLQQTIYIPHT